MKFFTTKLDVIPSDSPPHIQKKADEIQERIYIAAENLGIQVIRVNSLNSSNVNVLQYMLDRPEEYWFIDWCECKQDTFYMSVKDWEKWFKDYMNKVLDTL